MTRNYKLIKRNKFKSKKINLDLHNNNGYRVKPKNKIKYDGIVVNEMMIIKPSMIEKLLKRKINNKLTGYLDYIIEVLDSDETDSGRVGTVLSDLNRYREIVKNNYRQYLNEKYIELLLKKIELLEYELNKKLMYLNAYNCSKNNSYIEEKEETRKRTR